MITKAEYILSDLAGSEGTYTFRFLADGDGQIILGMVYRRPGEEDV